MKHLKILLLFSFTLFVLSEPSLAYKKWKFENCSTDNVDNCARVVFLYGNRDLVLPDNERDMVPHCNEEKSAVKCVNTWAKKCLKAAFPRQAASMLTAGAARNIRERCAPVGTKWYLKNFKCVNDSAESLHKCMDIMVEDIDSIKHSNDKQNWLAIGCCFVDKWKHCFEKAVKPFCDADGVKFLRWATDSYVSDLTDLACSTKLRWKSNRCNQLINTISKKSANSTESKPKSIYLPMYRLIVEFADWESVGAPNIKPAE